MNPCPLCGELSERREHAAREMMFGTREQFAYAECSGCGALELLDVPEDLARYYPSNYYAFRQAEKRTMEPRQNAREEFRDYMARKRTNQLMGKPSLVGALLVMRYRPELPKLLRWFRDLGFNLSSSILDVGCGNGWLLRYLEGNGMTSLAGIDPFIPHSTSTGKRIRIYKESLFEHVGKYDGVMLNHSFEHMADPARVLHELHRLLKPSGKIMIRIPVADSFAWRHYGVDWVQLDAPRHLFLHTRKSIQALAAQTGLELTRIECDSDEFQFSGSELYRRDVPLVEQSRNEHFSPEEKAEFSRRAAELNDLGDGDQAAFFFQLAGSAS